MHSQFYIPYFAINPYGTDVPVNAMQAAAVELEAQLGGAWQVLAAKAAFEEAGGLNAYWRGLYPQAITRWTLASQAAAQAAFRTEQPRQRTLDDVDLLNDACLDVIPAARYAYTDDQWLTVFTVHFGLTDHCTSRDEALAVGRHWLSITPEACPIAAAEQEIRNRSRRQQSATSEDLDVVNFARAHPEPASNPRQESRTCC